MSDRFKVGQPVWSISVRDGKWRPGVVTGPNVLRAYFAVESQSFVERMAYHVHVPDARCDIGFRQDHIFCKQELNLRPRDEGQFTPADDSFEWQNTRKQEEIA